MLKTRTTEYLASSPPQLQYIHQAGLRTYGRIHSDHSRNYSRLKFTNYRCGGSVGFACGI